jgi:transposase
MSKIPTRLTADQFAVHVEPHLSKARRGFVSHIPLYKIFNYVFYILHTGCQWRQLPIDPDPLPQVYKHRICAERTFAWVDKFKRVLIRFERNAMYFFGFNCLAFPMLNLRNVLK